MADIKIVLKTAEGSEATYENFEILSWTTTTTCTSDPSSPIFDVFPNSGQVVLKDTKLELYENAIMGAYDNSFNFELDIYIDGKIIAHHIINQQPYYNYEDKTLTLNLGNELDITNELVYEGYTYPLQEENLYLVFLKIMPALFSISSIENDTILGKNYDTIFDKTTSQYFNRSFKAYFNTLTIEYPYLSSKPQREVLKNLLTLAKCCMYQDENKKLVLVRMDGGFEQSVDFEIDPPDTLYDNVNFVLPDQINKGFVPSIIQKNNYNVAEISCNKVSQKTNNGAYYKKEALVNSEEIYPINAKTKFSDELLDGTTVYYIDGDKSFTRTGVVPAYLTGKFLTSEEKLFANFGITVSLFQKNNLIKVLEPIDKNNILFSLTKGKITKTITTGKLYLVEDLDKLEIVAYSYVPLNTVSTTETIIPAFSQPKIVKYEDLYLSFNNIEESDVIVFQKDEEFIYYSGKYLGCKYKYFKFDNSEIKTPSVIGSRYLWLENVTCEEITLTPLSASFSFNGDYTEIEFNGETITTPDPSTIQNPNKLVVANGGGLMQHVGDITATSFPVQYGLDLLGWAKGGIKTGELTVIKDQYTNKKGKVIVGSENHKIFKVGDLIVPCKDYNYNPIISDSNGNPVIYKVVEATTYGEGGAVFQDLKVRQVKVKKAEELPYYLVANDTGITICIRENGYATEGSNNQIIQIAWQT